MTTDVVIGIGSNTADAPERVAKAMEWLDRTFGITSRSSIYSTPAERGASGTYFNAVAVITSGLTHAELNSLLKGYEFANGRTPAAKAAHIVTIDLDIVIYGQTILRPADISANYFLLGYEEIKQSATFCIGK